MTRLAMLSTIRLLLLAAAAVASAGVPSHAAAPAAAFPYRAEILEEGLFRPVDAQTRSGVRGTASGRVHEHAAVELVQATRSFAAARGLTFGYRYRISGLPKKAVAGFAMRALHPAMKGADGKSRTVSTARTFVDAENGVAENEIVYTLNDAAEVLPGKWELQLLYRGQVVLAREFELK